MSLLALLGITHASADAAAPAAATPQGSFLSILPMLLVFVVIFYFFLIRPQSKRAREQKELMSGLAVGEEVVTSGGIVGRVTRLQDNFVVLTTGKNVELLVQKNAIASILPKGTLENIEQK